MCEKEQIEVVLGQEPNLRKAADLRTDRKKDCFILLKGTAKRPRRWRHRDGYVAVELDEYTVVSTYFSPNGADANFEHLLDELELLIRTSSKPVIVGCDLNARMAMANDRMTTKRGKMLEEWTMKNGLVLHNVGNTPTYSSSRGSSIIDVTITTATIAAKIRGWTVEETEELLSDHFPVKFSVHAPSPDSATPSTTCRGWKATPQALTALAARFAKISKQVTLPDPDKLMKTIIAACNLTLKKRDGKNSRKPVYWWSEEIAAARKVCITKRRELQRERKRRPTVEREQQLYQAYSKAKKDYQAKIDGSKREKWQALCKELDDNVWGTAYQIVTKRLKHRRTELLDHKTVAEQFEKLFPQNTQTGEREERVEEAFLEPPREFTHEELMQAVKGLKKRRAPGEDCITNEMLTVCVNANPKIFLATFNVCMATGKFPPIWKRAVLILIEKPQKMNQDRSYHPLCMLSTVGKLLGRLINARIVAELEASGKISEEQFGYRKGRGTVDAVMSILRDARERKKISLPHRGFRVMVLLDVKNAFNSLPWQEVKKAMRRDGVSGEMTRLLDSYLSERVVILPGGEERKISCGLPQGSVVGGTLWNLCYDSLLRIKLERGVRVVAYADDLAVIVRGSTESELVDKAEYCVAKIGSTLRKMGLQLAPQKTEMVILEGRRKLTSMSIRVEGTVVTSTNSVKYLGVHIDKDIHMKTHVIKTAERSMTTINSLSRIMPRVGGPGQQKRKLLATVVRSIALYAAPAWEDAMKYQKYKNLLRSVERKTSILVTAAYRTVSTEAVSAIAGCPPYDLLVWERARNWESRGKEATNNRQEMLRRWQERWSQYGGWASVFIKDVRAWQERGPPSDYHTTQAMTGHGAFGTYLKKIKKMDSDECWFGCRVPDTPAHTVFECAKFRKAREEAEDEIAQQVREQNVAELLLNEHTSVTVMGMLRSIMREKEAEELMREREASE